MWNDFYIKFAFVIFGPSSKNWELFIKIYIASVVPTKSNSGVILCLQLLSKTLTCTHHLS